MLTLLRRLLSTLAAVVGISVMASVSAYAVPPFAITDQLTVRDTTLSQSDSLQIQHAIDEIQRDHGIAVRVVFVDTLDEYTSEGWSNEAFKKSSIPLPSLMLVVATEDREFNLHNASTLSTPQMQTLVNTYLLPVLRNPEKTWGDIGPALVEGLAAVSHNEDAHSSPTVGGSGGAGMGLPVFALVAIIGGIVVMTVRRTSRHRSNTQKAVEMLENPQWDDPNFFSTVPLQKLHDFSRETLITTDNALKQAKLALGQAEVDYGHLAIQEFQPTIQKASANLAQAFSLRQELDDAFPETPQQQHVMLSRLLRLCHEAGEAIRAKSEEFEEFRNIVADPEPRLDALTKRVVANRARMTYADEKLDAIQQRYEHVQLDMFRANVTGAKENTDLAESTLDQARMALTEPSDKQSLVATYVVQIESLLGQAERLLDSIDHADEDICHAQTHLGEQLEQVKKTLADAEDFINQPVAQQSFLNTASMKNAIDVARQAIKKAEKNGNELPLQSYNSLVSADTTLHTAFLTTTAAANSMTRQAATVQEAIATADAQIRAAADIVNTRAGVVQATARTRLSQAEVHLQSARSVQTSDNLVALQEAQRALMLAQESQRAAIRDQNSYMARLQQHPHNSGSSAQDFLGGLLLGYHFSPGNSHAGWCTPTPRIEADSTRQPTPPRSHRSNYGRSLGGFGGGSVRNLGGNFGSITDLGGKF